MKEDKTQKATFGAGCFWGVEDAFRKLKGVKSTKAGYMGGHLKDPTYEDVCRGDSGHAEVVQVTYNPEEVSYMDLLDLFWKIHDPTTLNRQGPDIGYQYRSAIFYHNLEQKAQVLISMEKLQSSPGYDREIVTVIEPATTFYQAEEYHQQYLEKTGKKSCHFF
ncbi:MAG: peptide-methionine (S)-S-oxide reductase [Methanobacterium sp.]|nr:MAG: peptide-methionine (S)-S-oxide reductase [Methanobacterium sp.]